MMDVDLCVPTLLSSVEARRARVWRAWPRAENSTSTKPRMSAKQATAIRFGRIRYEVCGHDYIQPQSHSFGEFGRRPWSHFNLVFVDVKKHNVFGRHRLWVISCDPHHDHPDCVITENACLMPAMTTCTNVGTTQKYLVDTTDFPLRFSSAEMVGEFISAVPCHVQEI